MSYTWHVRFLVTVVVLSFLGCGQTRTVPGARESEETGEATPTETPSPTAVPVAEARNAPEEPSPSLTATRAQDVDGTPSAPLEESMMREEAIADRRQRFGLAVEALSAALARPISAERAREDAPCGGWAGPACSNWTLGIEISRAVIPIAVSFYDLDYARVTAVLAQAVAEHSVWHDAHGFLYNKTRDAQGAGHGPGYVYAGCIFGSCEPDNPGAGQIDGILYQLARITGILEGPACGPRCSLQAPQR